MVDTPTYVIEMPAKEYITVTLKKRTLQRLLRCKNATSTSKAVTDAIDEYVHSLENSKPMRKTPDVTFIGNPTGTPYTPYIE